MSMDHEQSQGADKADRLTLKRRHQELPQDPKQSYALVARAMNQQARTALKKSLEKDAEPAVAVGAWGMGDGYFKSALSCDSSRFVHTSSQHGILPTHPDLRDHCPWLATCIPAQVLLVVLPFSLDSCKALEFVFLGLTRVSRYVPDPGETRAAASPQVLGLTPLPS